MDSDMVSSSYTYKCSHYVSFPLSKCKDEGEESAPCCSIWLLQSSPTWREAVCFSIMTIFLNHCGPFYFTVSLQKSQRGQGFPPLPFRTSAGYKDNTWLWCATLRWTQESGPCYFSGYIRCTIMMHYKANQITKTNPILWIKFWEWASTTIIIFSSIECST